MDGRVEIVAVPGPGGTTVLPTLRAHGLVAARPGPPGRVSQVCLVGTAAGPVGGDEVRVMVRVAPGARVRLGSAAATVAYPGRREARSSVVLDLEVGEGGELEVALEPTVVCHRAVHESLTGIRIEPGARLVVREEVVLGRFAEPPGEWAGRTVADLSRAPLLRHTVRSASLLASAARALVTVFEVGGPGVPAAARCAGTAVLLPLAGGGTLVTATGPDLTGARSAEAALRPRPAGVPARVAPHPQVGGYSRPMH